jgi:hypothetical protein
MPRFHFHVEDGAVLDDVDGTELPGVPAAQEEAARYFGQLLQERAKDLFEHQVLKLTVTDARGLVLFVLEMTAMLSPALKPNGPLR